MNKKLRARFGSPTALLILVVVSCLPAVSFHAAEEETLPLAANLDFGEWGDAFPNKLLGAATLDRLRHGAYRIILDGESYRTPRSLTEEGK
jgi:hypothetical protein